MLKPQIYEAATELGADPGKTKPKSFISDSVEAPKVQFEPILVTPSRTERQCNQCANCHSRENAHEGFEFSEQAKRIMAQIVDKSVPQVAGVDHQGFSKPRNTLPTHVQQVVNTVEVKTLNIIKKTMQGEKCDPDDDQSSKDQSSDRTGRDSSDSVPKRSRSSEFRKSRSKSRTRKDQSKIVYLKTGSRSEPLFKL